MTTPDQHADHVEEFERRAVGHVDSLAGNTYGLLAVASAILATGTPQPAPVDRLGHFVPVQAWSEFGIKAHPSGNGFAIWSGTLNRYIEPPEEHDVPLSIYEAITRRDNLIRQYASTR